MVDATREIRRVGQAHDIPRATVDAKPVTNSRNPKVLYVVSMFPCWSETFIVREIQVLIEQGVDVRILSLRKWNETFRQTDTQEMQHRVTYPPSWLLCAGRTARAMIVNPGRAFNDLRKIVRSLWRRPIELAKTIVVWIRVNGVNSEMERLRPDHIHAHWATYPSTAAFYLAERLNCPFSFTAHAHDIFLHDHLLSEKFDSAAFVATISEFNRRLLRERKGDIVDQRTKIIRCGVVPQRIPQKAKQRLLSHQNTGRVVSVGRLDEIKGFPVLLEACRLLDASGVEFVCDIAGEGPLEPVLRRFVKQHGLQDRVCLHGALPSTQINELLQKANVFVLASQRARNGNMDGIPVALMEAMSAGLPCVSTAVSGIPELLVDEVNGLLVPPGDAQALAEAIRRILEKPELAARLASSGLKRVQTGFNAELEARKLLNLFQRTIEKRERRAVCAGASFS